MTRKKANTAPKQAQKEEIHLVGPPVWAELLKVAVLGACFMLGMAGMAGIVAKRVVDHIDCERERDARRSRIGVPHSHADTHEHPRIPIMAITKATKPREKEIDLFEYRAKLIHIVDGDTVDLQVDLGFYMEGRIRFRLSNIDTPEIRGPERAEGLVSKAFVEDVLGKAEDIMVRTEKAGKFGRWIADIYYRLPGDPEPVMEKDESGIMTLKAKWRHLNKELLDKGLAEEYGK